MSAPDPKQRLLDLALAVSDGRAVDWRNALEESPDLEGPLAGLRALSLVAGELPPETDDVPDLFTWGSLRARRPLGSGSFGEVYAAFDPTLQREVALKLRRADAGGSGTLAWLDEARRLARVRHPNVLTVYGADVHDGRAGMWTELLAGRTLEDALRAQGPLGPREAALVGLDLCAALAAVHAAGLVHGDVKTANVMRVGAASGDPSASGRIVLMDFGAAHDGIAGAPLGTPLAAAPEVLRGEAPTAASDVYSLGVLLFRLVTGRWPVQAASLDELRRAHERGERVALRALRPELPHGFVAALERALEPDPTRRPSSASAFERELARVVAPEAPAPTSAAGSRARLPLAPIAIAVTLLVAIAVIALWRSGKGGGPVPVSPPRTASRPPAQAEAPRTSSSSPAAPAAVAAAPTATSMPEVDAALLLVGDGARHVLHTGDPVAPGDRIALEVGVRPAAHVYVLEEDAAGNTTVLFPLPDGPLRNPLRAGETHRLPGQDASGALDWQVTSAGGQERFLVAAATTPVPELEDALRSLSAAREGAAVRYPSLAPDAVVRLRGVAGVARDPGVRPDHSVLSQLAHRLGAPGRGVWLRLVVLENP